ncbi:MAG: hypothetical protein WCG83_06145 [Candidatus Peregrinibacteria bacterium]
MSNPDLELTEHSINEWLSATHREAVNIQALLNCVGLIEKLTVMQLRQLLSKNNYSLGETTIYMHKRISDGQQLFSALFQTADGKIVRVGIDKGGSYEMITMIDDVETATPEDWGRLKQNWFSPTPEGPHVRDALSQELIAPGGRMGAGATRISIAVETTVLKKVGEVREKLDEFVITAAEFREKFQS